MNPANDLLKRYYDLITNVPTCISQLADWSDNWKSLNQEIIEFFKIKTSPCPSNQDPAETTV